MRRLALASTLASCLFLPTGAWALGLGEIELQSALNQRLDAEIPLRGVPADQARNIEVELASEEAFQDVGLERPYSLTRLRFRVRQTAQGRYFVHVTSTEPIAEPFLSFLVQVDWPNGNLLREYTVLLDPPVFASEKDQGDAAGTEQAADPGDRDDAGVPGEIERSAETDAEQRTADEQASEGDQADTGEQAAQSGERGGDYGDEPVFLQVEREQEEAERRSQREAEKEAKEAKEAEREASEQTETAKQDSERRAESADQQRSAKGGGEYGPVEEGEALWSIAKRLKSGDVSVQQMMIALLRYNPEAFAGDNVNRLKEGYVLRVPDMAEVRDISAQKAIAQVGEQNAMWQEWRQARADGGAREAAPSEPTEASEAASTGGADDGELEIVGSQEGGATADEEASATASGEASTSEQLQLAREELESVQMEKEELTERVNELERTVEKMEKLITLREEKLSQLQQQLEALREEQPSQEANGGTNQTAETDTEDGAAGADDAEQTDEAEQAATDDDTAEIADAGESDEATDASDTTAGGAGETDESTEVAAADADTTDEAAGADETSGSGDSGGGGDTASDGGGGEAGSESGSASGDTGETTETTTAEADGDAGTATDDTAAGEASQADDQAAPEQGVQTTRTQPEQEGWLDMVAGVGAAAGGVIAGLFAGGVTSPGVLALAALLVLALVGALVARRGRAQGGEAEPTPEAMPAEAEGTELFTETDPGLEASTEAGETTGATTIGDTASAEAAESTLMEERLDLSDLEGGDESGVTAAEDDEEEEEASKDDTVAEADVYLAYGLHQQAEDVLRLALKASPQRADYQEKLLETLYGAGKRSEFVSEAKTYHGMIDPTSSRGWQRVVAMGREIAPDDALFRSAEDPGVSPDEFQPAKPESPDFELDTEGGDEPALDLSLDESGDESEAASADQGVSETMTLDTGGFEASEKTPGEARDTPVAETAGGREELEFDLSAWQDAEPEAPEPASAAEPETTSDSTERDDFEFDLSDLELAQPEEGESAASGEAGEPSAPESPSEEDLDLNLEGPGEDSGADTSAPQAPAEADTESGDDDLEFDLGDLDVGEEPTPAGPSSDDDSEASEPAPPAVEEPSAAAPANEEPEFDIDSLETLGGGDDASGVAEAADLDSQFLGSGEGLGEATSTPTGADKGAAEAGAGDAAGGESEGSSEQEEFDTMLDLAKAYIDMGDAESASNALQEVIESGTPAQRSEAEKLLETVQ